MKRALALAVVALAFMPACTRQDERRDELSDAIYRTETKPRTYIYDERSAKRTRVEGTIEDDYRYRADMTIGRAFASSVILLDDAHAFRFGKSDVQRSLDLPADRWLLDPHGANNLFTAEETNIGVRRDDAIFDSLDVLRYVRRAMGEAAAVQIFNPESQDYRPKFDRFPRPTTGVARYDIVPPTLTLRDPTTSTGRSQQIPGARYFRRMSVYVVDGAVREVRERISVEDMLNDPRSRLAARIGDYGIELPDTSTRTQARFLVDAINGMAGRLSQPGVRERELHVTFSYDDVARDVRLPTDADRVKLSKYGPIFVNSQLLYETPG